MSAIDPAEKQAAEHLLTYTDPDERKRSRQRIDRLVTAGAPPEDADDSPSPLAFDFDAGAIEPDYVVAGEIEYEQVAILTGDTGSAKSITGQDLTAAALLGRKWLGREVLTDRVLYLDEENPQKVPIARLRALGVTNEHRAGLRYYNRVGVTLGTDRWDEWLREEIEDHRPGVVLIDTVMAATAAEVNDNDSVVKLYKVLRRIASDLHVAIVLLHHDRKAQVGQTADRSQATMGARQWVGQADRQLTLKVKGDLERDPRPDGGTDLRREFVLIGGKDREAEDSGDELIAVTSGKSATGALEWMRVESEGEIEREPSEQELLKREIAEFASAAEDELTTAQIAEAVECEATDSTFKRALKDASRGRRAPLRKVKKGHYKPRAAKTDDALAIT